VNNLLADRVLEGRAGMGVVGLFVGWVVVVVVVVVLVLVTVWALIGLFVVDGFVA
jgi:hypothetical protein